jgi:hypothetical protein
MIQTAFERWFGAGENFHAEKCEFVTDTMDNYNLASSMAR